MMYFKKYEAVTLTQEVGSTSRGILLKKDTLFVITPNLQQLTALMHPSNVQSHLSPIMNFVNEILKVSYVGSRRNCCQIKPRKIFEKRQFFFQANKH